MYFGTVLIGIAFLINVSLTLDCDIIPEDVIKPKNINDIDRYIISILGNPKTYTPNQKYNVSLKINTNKMPQKAFKQFFLTLDSVDKLSSVQAYRPTGQFEFELGSQILTQFSDKCPNTVIENSNLPKWEIQVYWVAPPKNSGCVAIKATVLESRENWFSEDGSLTKILCEDSEINENVKPQLVDKCCACSEAKYEVAFEGRWTRNTHPRNYPSDIWSTKFSDIIGASHRKYHSFWNEQDYASDGLKELVQSGSTHTVESEIKEMGTNIRTIIKARGLQHPNITESSYAVFRVDSHNHLVSLASKITPSPDWFVGVANFELCKSDCTWAESYTYNLYPMDAGTDDGLGYKSSVPLLFSRKPIMPITPNNPNNPESPFFSEDGEAMNPIAKVHFTRQRLYEKPCDSGEQEDLRAENACATDKWTEWTPCSVACGLGQRVRMRTYLEPRKADNCYVPLVQHQTCQGTAKYCKGHRRTRPKKPNNSEEESKEESDSNDSKAETVSEEEKGSKEETTSYEKYSKEEEDSREEKESGEEKKSNEEEQKNSSKERKSEENYSNDSEEEQDNGSKETKDENEGDDDCAVGEWSEWSSCSVSCGVGTKTRDRKFLLHQNEDKCEDVELQENRRCKGENGKCSENESKCTNTNWGPWSSCSVSCGLGVKRRLRLPSENGDADDNQNADEEENTCSNSEIVKCHIHCDNHKFGESLIIEQKPDGRVVNCKTTNWSIWSKCDLHEADCGRGTKKRYRQITRHPENGGKACPKKLISSKQCHVHCTSSTEVERSVPEEDKKPQCIMSDWSDFTPCSSICGSSAMQLRTRKTLYKPPGVVCPPRVMYKPCNLPLACTSDGRPIFL